jgi:hypothetical protein
MPIILVSYVVDEKIIIEEKRRAEEEEERHSWSRTKKGEIAVSLNRYKKCHIG